MLSCLWLVAIPWTTLAHQFPLSMEFYRQKYWVRLPLPTPGDLPNPGTESESLVSPAFSGGFFFFFFFLPLHDLGSPQPQVGCLYWKCSVGSWKCGSCRLSGSKFLHRSSIVKEKNLFIFNWRIIALQYCVGFCHTSTWIIHRYTYVPSFLNIPRSSLSVPPLYVFTEHWFELPASHKFPLAILHMLLPYICYHTTLSIHPTFSFTTVSTSLFSMILIWWKFSVIHCYDCHR